MRERHAQFGEVAFLLEPDLKEGRGGLRDVHGVQWAEAARTVMLEGDDANLAEAYEMLLGARGSNFTGAPAGREIVWCSRSRRRSRARWATTTPTS